jgi:hypothetical protein
MNRYKLQNVLPVKKKQDDDRAPDDDCPEIIVRSEGVTSSFSSNPFTVPATVRFRIYAETLSSFLMGLLRGVEYLESKDKLAPEEGAFVGWIEDTKDRVTVRISKEELPSVQKFLKDNLGSPESGIPHLRIRLPFLVILTELTDIIHDLQSSPDLAFLLR